MNNSTISVFLMTGYVTLIISHLLDARASALKCILTAFLLGLMATWLFVDSLSGYGLDYATLYHIRTGLTGAGIADFKVQILHFAGNMILSATLAISATWLARRLGRRSKLALCTYLTGAITILVCNPLSQDVWRLAHMEVGDGATVTHEYLLPTAGPSFQRKNIVLIYAESLERTYFDQTAFPGLVPNLQRLASQGIDYTDVRPAPGTGWTIAGMVASQCGIPLTLWQDDDSNSMGRINQFLPGATCIGDWLADNDYTLEFMGGANSEFAGKDKFLTGHGFSKIYDYQTFKQQGLPDSAFSSWGLHDDVLIEKAAERFEQLSQGSRPFLLSVLTLDTHHYSGHVPAGCNGITYTGLDRRYPILDAVACSDKLLSRFIDKIRSGPYAEETLVVLASDHLSMPNDAEELLAEIADKRRNMLIILGENIAPARINFPTTPLDTGAIFFSQLGGTGKLGFGRTPGEQVIDGFSYAMLLGENIAPYQAYAQSLWQLAGAESVRLIQDGKLQVGTQLLTPPIVLVPGADGKIKEISLVSDIRKFEESSSDWIYFAHCAAFKAKPDHELCALANIEGKNRHLFNQADLVRGLNLERIPTDSEKTDISLIDNYIVRTHFEPEFPHAHAATISNGSIYSVPDGGVLFNGPFLPMPAGMYRVSITGDASGSKKAWGDVIAAGGNVRLAGGPLLVTLARGSTHEVFSADFLIEKDVENIEIRVYAAPGDDVRIDGYSLIPLQ